MLSGSANFPWADTHSNLNNVVVFHNAYVCRQYQAEVEQLQRASFGRGLHGELPRTYDLSGVPVRVLFAPDHTPELEIMKQLLKGVLDPGRRPRTGPPPSGSSTPTSNCMSPNEQGCSPGCASCTTSQW